MSTLKIGDVVRKRSAREPYPPLYRVVEIIGSEVLMRPVGGGNLIQTRSRAVTTQT